MVRVWLEEVDDGRTEWRGKAQRVVSGETLYFRDWDSMLAFLRGDSTADPAIHAEQLPVKAEQSGADEHGEQHA